MLAALSGRGFQDGHQSDDNVEVQRPLLLIDECANASASDDADAFEVTEEEAPVEVPRTSQNRLMHRDRDDPRMLAVVAGACKAVAGSGWDQSTACDSSEPERTTVSEACSSLRECKVTRDFDKDPEIAGEPELLKLPLDSQSRRPWRPRHVIPDIKAGKPYVKWMLPIFLLVLAFSLAAPWFVMYPDPLSKMLSLLHVVSWIPWWMMALGVGGSAMYELFVYGYHLSRLRGTDRAPCLADGHAPLIHAVVVVAYQEPIEVLRQTFESIAEQKGIRHRPLVVFATEERDESREEFCQLLRAQCGERVCDLLLTEHVLREGEAAGKGSNENWAVRDLYRRLERQGVDPWNVMVTIVDADSIMSHTYLAHLEHTYNAQRDGRRLLYNGPLNTYRNFARGNLLTQMVELGRCHQDMFFDPCAQLWFPMSNYSLLLGFAQEIDFWTVDCIPEDMHTSFKAMINNLGSITTVPIPSIICNDLVEGVSDRYVQAKRHLWSTVHITWLIAVLRDMPGGFRSWWGMARLFLQQENSVVWVPMLLAANLWAGVFGNIIWHHGDGLLDALPWNITFLAGMLKYRVLLSGVLFWTSEALVWRTLLRQFPIERPSFLRWTLLVLLSPLLGMAARWAFSTAPVLDVILHASFRGDLAYVKAPKGATTGSDPLPNARLA